MQDPWSNRVWEGQFCLLPVISPLVDFILCHYKLSFKTISRYSFSMAEKKDAGKEAAGVEQKKLAGEQNARAFGKTTDVEGR